MGGTVIGLHQRDITPPLRLLTPPGQRLRIQPLDQPPDLRPDLTRRLPRRPGQHLRLDGRRDLITDLAGALPQRAGLEMVDISGGQRSERSGQPPYQLRSEPDQPISRGRRERQRRRDLIIEILTRRDHLNTRSIILSPPPASQLRHRRQLDRLHPRREPPRRDHHLDQLTIRQLTIEQLTIEQLMVEQLRIEPVTTEQISRIHPK
ncbi:hypothetical protein GCM10027176_66510 [Actinoallomurus bryophytorum]